MNRKTGALEHIPGIIPIWTINPFKGRLVLKTEGSDIPKRLRGSHKEVPEPTEVRD